MDIPLNSLDQYYFRPTPIYYIDLDYKITVKKSGQILQNGLQHHQ